MEKPDSLCISGNILTNNNGQTCAAKDEKSKSDVHSWQWHSEVMTSRKICVTNGQHAADK